ncbi:1-phosphofructokinase [Bacillus sp. B-jedd]|uniref:1-phosphofructokinase n=1 Tax=Bacillus sp. B-jedd TaxID=1476857 RepID=UPI000515720E|nr:1-phosphofructokinase [Bacillus sp. B-jedd]CEG28572.1 tagatose-6-phosphate kinase [Bacillus sp. B-jedd]
MEKHSILTVTLNPAIDTAYRLDELAIGESTRTANPIKTAGGKGLNVTRVLKLLGEEVTATGFLGGSNGVFIRGELRKLGVTDAFVQIEGETRQCLAFIDREKRQTEILEEGPFISAKEAEEFRVAAEGFLKDAGIVAISGSLPKGVSSELYQSIIETANRGGAKVLLDTSGDALANCLSARPFLIKPNRHELEQLIGKTCGSEDDIWEAMAQIAENGIPAIVVSDGENGSFVLYEGKRFYVAAAKVETVSAVGSGDSFIAGVAAGLARGYSFEEVLRLASACGAANAMEAKTGYIQAKYVEKIASEIVVKGL